MTFKKSLALILALSIMLGACPVCAAAAGISADSGSSGDGDDFGIIANRSIMSEPVYISAESILPIIDSGGENVSISVSHNSVLSGDVVEKLLAAGKPVTFNAPGYSVRIDPAQISTVSEIRLGASGAAYGAQAIFENFYSNRFASVKLAQRGGFGGTVELSIVPSNINRLDLSKGIYAFSYNINTNSFMRLPTPIVSNGKMVFTLTRGYDIIITDSPLSLKQFIYF